MKYRDVARRLAGLGCVEMPRRSGGSHRKWSNPATGRATVLVATMILLFLASVGIYYFERTAQPDKMTSIFDGMWWAVVTLTTVGYGDVFPVTVGGKVFTFLVLVLGLGIVAVPTGLFASALSRARTLEEGEDASGIDGR